MAEFRQIHTRIWKDAWFSELEPDAKLLFTYLFSNERASVCGAYELPLKYVAFETGLGIDRVSILFLAFEKAKKAYYRDGVVWVVNLRKYNETASPKVQARIVADLRDLPDGEIKRMVFAHYGIPYRYGMDTPSGVEERDGDRYGDGERDGEAEGASAPAIASPSAAPAAVDEPLPAGERPTESADWLTGDDSGETAGEFAFAGQTAAAASPPPQSGGNGGGSHKGGKAADLGEDAIVSRVFASVTGMFAIPGKPEDASMALHRIRQIVAEKGGADAAIAYLLPFWNAWLAAGYRKSNNGWLDWAIANQVPTGRRGARGAPVVRDQSEIDAMAHELEKHQQRARGGVA